MDTTLAVNRTPELIAIEINSIKNHTRTTILLSSIEIGRRLAEAKSLLPHGEWGKWLETSVDYSQSTANNLMRIFEEYGSNQFSLLGDHQAKSQALANLSYTQAVALLGIPQEDREKFVKDNDVKNMSTRELEKAIKDLKAEQEKAADLELKISHLQEQKESVEKVRDNHAKVAETLKKELEKAQSQLKEAQESGNDEEVERLQESLNKTESDLEASILKIKELERQLKEQPIDEPIEKIPDEVQKELDDLRSNKQLQAAVQKYGVYFDVLVKGFKDLLTALTAIKDIDPAAHEQYRNTVTGLISKMSEHLK